MTQRYYCPDMPASDEDIVLDGPEAHHLAGVMRGSTGDQVVLFDGRGGECDASVAAVGKRVVRLRITSRRKVDREAAIDLTLAVALPKGERQRWLVEKATELGVRKVIPLITQRSVVSIKASGAQRLERFVIEASKQCGRNRLMEIGAPMEWRQLVEESSGDDTRLVAHPPGEHQQAGKTEAEIRSALRGGKPVIAAIGPEGGLADDEVQAAVAAGWQRVSLGPRVLRVETAALALAALLLLD